MKKITYLLGLFVLCLTPIEVLAPPLLEEHFQELKRVQEETRKTLLAREISMKLLAIAIQESRLNPNAQGATNDGGILQITPICVKEANNTLGYKKYKHKDVYDPVKAVEIFMIIQKKYNPTFNFEKMARIWNGGPGGMNLDKVTSYWQSVKGIHNQLENGSIRDGLKVFTVMGSINIFFDNVIKNI